MKLTDEDLMVLVSSGDQNSFGVLVQRYLDFSVRYLKKRGCFSPEDVSQETFIKVWRFAKRYSSKKSLFKTWFFSILQNEWKSFGRKNYRHESDFKLDLDDLGQSETPETIFGLEQRKEKLNKRIESLSPKLKEIFLLKYLDELKAQEISSLTGLELKAVESRLLRAKKILTQKGK